MDSAQKQPEAERRKQFAKGWEEMASKVVKKAETDKAVKKIKAELGEWGDKLPNSALVLIAQSKNPAEGLGQTKKALDEMVKAARGKQWYVFEALGSLNPAHESDLPLMTLELARIFDIYKSRQDVTGEVSDVLVGVINNQNLGSSSFHLCESTLIKILNETDPWTVYHLLVRLKKAVTNAKDSSVFEKFEKTSVAEGRKAKPFYEKYGVGTILMRSYFNPVQVIPGEEGIDASTKKHLRETILKASKRSGLDPNFLAAVAFKEGLILDMVEQPDKLKLPYGLSTADFGMDTFVESIAELKDKGYLRQDFTASREYKNYNFRDIDCAFEAFSALLASRRDSFLSEVKRMGVNPKSLSELQVWAGSYLFYNAVSPAKRLHSLGLRNLTSKYTKVDATTLGAIRIWDYRYNFLRVIATADFLKKSGTFAP
ncbi:Uncharacterised protein [Candidatus Gugararchaeum adminiculabundum]|nr:Uncharacterised protein [Candidatus Gugararchaeum adminiculabundum]